ncbi:MAG: hypothetical protein ISS50_01295 [Anaerolineae bacterium]|nr:hypothetical protein [Anaerolineae bacterium]
MIDITIPRECIYQEFEEQPGPCPRCGGPLQSHRASYLVITKREEEITDNFIIGGGDIGWFCARCPTVVINPDEVSELLMHPLPHWDVGEEFVLAGIIDLDAIPEEKRHLPLGDDDNPIPIVEFTNIPRDEEPPPLVVQSGIDRKDPSLPFEERYQDVLQNIEFGIVQAYRNHPEMTDWEVLSAIEALLRTYRAKAKGRQVAPPSLDPLADAVYDFVKSMCEWRLGRERPFTRKDGEPVELLVEPITLDELMACLKRVRKSINRWHRRGGRQGYLTFVSQFVR